MKLFDTPTIKKSAVAVAMTAVVAAAAIFGTPAPAGANAEGDYIPGTYTASAYGFGGDVTANITINEKGGISAVQLEGASETPDVGQAALPALQTQVLEAQSAQIDGVSGATLTSDAVRSAMTTALAEASGEEIVVNVPAEGDLFVPGTYTSSAKGFGGDITVTVTVDEDEITDVQIEGEKETVNIGTFAIDLLDEDILEAQTSQVDALSGATVSSNAIIKAATEALTESGADVKSLENQAKADENAEKTEESLQTDIVIVGAGGAGMVAAINATQQGKDVILVEKMPYAGGNTTKATGGMNAAETHYQEEQGIEDSVEQFVEDTMAGGHDLNDIDLVTKMAEESSAAIDWLDTIGAELPKVAFSGGATNARIHAPEDGSGVGAYLVTAFLKQLDELNINVMYNTEATSIIMKDGKAAGIMAQGETANYTIEADAVILATGGFGNNQEMICEYRPDLEGTVTTNSPGATGDGIKMAQEVGADTVDLDQIQLHPTVEQATSMLITESVRGNGAILVNQSGVRFINEMETRDVVSAGELEQEGGYAYVVFDQNLRDNLGAIEKYVETGIVVQADTYEELAELLEIDPDVFTKTMADWNGYVADQKDPDFGRDTAMDADLSAAPYYAIKIAPGIHHTMGGLKIDTDTEVIDTEGEVIPGLFAAGEVTGGVHGGNRLGGNAVADIVVFGRQAADSAVEYVNK